jgi:hypothetical protein
VSESLGCHIVELSVVYPRSLPLYSFDFDLANSFDLAILSLASDDHTRIPLQDINWMMQIRVSDASCAQCQTYLYLLCAIPISLFCFIGEVLVCPIPNTILHHFVFAFLFFCAS